MLLYLKKDEKSFNSNFLNENLNIHFRNPVTLISCLINSNSKNKFAINITDKNLSESGYYSYNKSKLLLSEYSKNMNFYNKKYQLKNLNQEKCSHQKMKKTLY